MWALLSVFSASASFLSATTSFLFVTPFSCFIIGDPFLLNSDFTSLCWLLSYKLLLAKIPCDTSCLPTWKATKNVDVNIQHKLKDSSENSAHWRFVLEIEIAPNGLYLDIMWETWFRISFVKWMLQFQLLAFYFSWKLSNASDERLISFLLCLNWKKKGINQADAPLWLVCENIRANKSCKTGCFRRLLFGLATYLSQQIDAELRFVHNNEFIRQNRAYLEQFQFVNLKGQIFNFPQVLQLLKSSFGKPKSSTHPKVCHTWVELTHNNIMAVVMHRDTCGHGIPAKYFLVFLFYVYVYLTTGSL